MQAVLHEPSNNSSLFVIIDIEYYDLQLMKVAIGYDCLHGYIMVLYTGVDPTIDKSSNCVIHVRSVYVHIYIIL